MKHLALTLPTPAENLACDEALLDWCEDGDGEELLRFWEPTEYFVVVGYANKIAVEVNSAACAAAGVPIHRRCSGGGTVLQGPGCLNYSLVLRLDEDAEPPTSNEQRRAHLTPGSAPLTDATSTFNIQHSTFNSEAHLRSITAANRFIMERNRAAIENLLSHEPSLPQPSASNPQPLVSIRGHTDLTLGGLKFSGNAQRRRKHFLLFHGTFLLNFELALVEKFLPMPSQQPAYRQNRSHAAFLVNLGLAAGAVKGALRTAWQAEASAEMFPQERVALLARDRYVTKSWNLKF